jgi:radical SAM family uncharacterized protein/radical SAM-linked protein
MSHPYDAFIHRVERPARYLGGEFRSLTKPWEETPVRVALAFPDVYEIGMSHLGLRILYDHLNRDPRILAERVYAPWVDLEAELRSHSVPLVSLESARPLAQFDCIGFSLQYELTFTNLLNMLDLSGIPLRASRRDNSHPLIVGGGPVATQPEPMAPFIDCFVIGDGEEYFPRLLKKYVEWREEGLDRMQILERLAALGGIYCPALYPVEVEPITGLQVVQPPRRAGVPERVVRQIVPDLNAYPFPATGPVASTEVVFDRFSMEIARGCTEGCRFCQAGMIYRPVRERSPDQIIDTVLEAVKKNGYDETSLTSLSTADVSCISPLVKRLMERLREEKVALSVSSLRAYGLPEDLLDAISDVRNTSLTFAPEAGTQRMRDVVSKNISEEDMEKSAHSVFSRGWKRVKLYFMIGLPTETEEDVRGIAETARRYLAIADHYHRGKTAEVTASVSSFIPKPHTPFHWAQMSDIAEIKAKQELLMALTRGTRVKLKWHDPRVSHIEAYMARGDRRMADLVEYAFLKGCRFDGWTEQLRFEVWMQGIEELGIERGNYLRTFPLDARLPWDHIDVGVTTDFLKKEYRKALLNRLSPPCGKPFRAKVHHTNVADASADQRRLVCFDCGIACDLTQMREERKDFLVRLEAFDPPRPAAAASGDGERPVEEIRRRNGLPRNRVENAQKLSYRLRFTKLGTQRFISHLDLVRLLPRIFRRAGVALAYSRGFHPKPILVFSPALTLGFGSLAEYLDVVSTEELEPAELLLRLNRASPDGIRFEAAARLEPGDSPLSRVIDACDYRAALPADLDLQAVEARARSIASGERVVIRREREGVTRELDITAAILKAVPSSAPEPHLDMRFLFAASPSGRPGEVYHWITGRRCPPQEMCRTGLWRLENDQPIGPLELEALRAPRAAVAPSVS